jgi:hypothetical protein
MADDPEKLTVAKPDDLAMTTRSLWDRGKTRLAGDK